MDKLEISAEVQSWMRQIDAARKREDKFRKAGRRVVDIYEAEKRDETPYNVLFSNTETLAPALYNNTPSPVVKRRYKGEDPVGLQACRVTERALSFLIDANDQDYANFDDLIKSATLESLLPGRGVTRFKYDATFSGEGDAKTVSKEGICGEEVPWDRVLFGYAKKWNDVPWICFDHFMNQEEAARNFGEEIAAKLPYPLKDGQEDAELDQKGGEGKSRSDEGIEKLAHVMEIWDKSSKKVVFIAAAYPEVIKSVEDPLGLSGFFPCPKPLQMFTRVSSNIPVALYSFYENQAEELNIITNRIKALTKALKVRGFYDSTLSALEKLFEKDDNTLLPAENVSAMLQGQTLDKAIWLMPLEKIITVLQQLYIQRQQIKDVIYEITGVSDILRGSSVASETATAQNIKNQWGTLRLKKAQKEVQRYVRDCLRIMAEIAVTKLDAQTLASMTGIQLPTKAQQEEAKAVMAQQQQAGMQPQPNPILNTPAWEDVLQLLQNDLQRKFRIDIETNSTVDVEATEDKTDVAEFMNAFSQFLNGVAPMIEQGYMQFDVAKTLLMAIVRRFRFGTEVEDALNAMQPPPPKQPGDDPKAQVEAAQAKLDMQRQEAQFAHDQQAMQQKAQLQEQEMQLKEAELQLKREELAMKRELMQAQHANAMLQIKAKAIEAVAQANAPKPVAKNNSGGQGD